MPRPVKPRFVSEDPEVCTFGPWDTPPTGEATLFVEQISAVKFALDQAVSLAADGAATSRSCFSLATAVKDDSMAARVG